MAVKPKLTGRAMSVPAGLTLGAGIGMGLTVLLAAVLAKLVETEKLPWDNIGYGVMVILLLASYAGAIGSYAQVKRQRFMVCMMSGMIYFAILLSMTALFFGGQYQAVGVTAALIFCGSACAGLLGLRQGRGARRKKLHTHHR